MVQVMIQRMGQLLLAVPFILGGWEAARDPGYRVEQAAAAGVPRPEMAVRANGFIMVVAGIALAFGRLPRWAAAMLAMVLIPTTLTGHAFWKETTSKQREGQLTHFVKNLSMLGGLLEVLAGSHE
ncbi:MAG TPA: DoxX family protein [Chloroflexota bacterium]